MIDIKCIREHYREVQWKSEIKLAEHALKHVINSANEKKKWTRILTGNYYVDKLSRYYDYHTTEKILNDPHDLLDQYEKYSKNVIKDNSLYYLHFNSKHNTYSINFKNSEEIETAVHISQSNIINIVTCFHREHLSEDAVVLGTITTVIQLDTINKIAKNINLNTNDFHLKCAMERAADSYLEMQCGINNRNNFCLNILNKNADQCDFLILSLYYYLIKVSRKDIDKREAYLPFLLTVQTVYSSSIKFDEKLVDNSDIKQKYMLKYKSANDSFEEIIFYTNQEDYEIFNSMFTMIVYGGKNYNLPQLDTTSKNDDLCMIEHINICYRAYKKLYDN